MEINQLKLFLAVYRRRSFTRVAEDRGLDPSTVSRAIATLESELGFSLFDRTTRKMTATEAGQVYFRRLDPLIDDLENAAELAGGSRLEPRGELRLLAPVSFSQLNLLPLLPDFLATYPGLRLDLQLSDATPDLVEHGIDVALRLGPLSDSSYLARRLAVMRSHVCASPSYLERRGKPPTPAELAEHDCLLLDMPGFGNRWRFRETRGRELHVDVEGPLKTSNAIALKQCALGGAGIILQGDWIIGRELAEGSLIDLFPDLEATASYFDNAIWTLRPRRAHEPAKVRAFLDFLHRAFAAGAPWASGGEQAP
ncbi:MAG: LysR family transcriptional regulator [Acidobacteriota bacterium]